MDSEPAEIVIRFDAGARPITGEVSAGAADPREFTGWAGLFAVLRAVADANGTHDSPATEVTGPCATDVQ